MTTDAARPRSRLVERLADAWRRLRGGSLSPLRAALSVAVGLFVGAVPLYGFQLLIVLGVCIPLRLDAAIAYLAANVSNPLTLPALLLIEIEIGALLLTGDHAVVTGSVDPERLGEYGIQLLVGAPVFGAGLATAGAAIAWALAGRTAGGDPLSLAQQKTVARYTSAPPSARFYARAKIEIDPLPRVMSTYERNLGHVVDCGAGVGQLGLFLIDLGRATELVGFDPDREAIDVARAAGPEGTFEVAGFETFTFPETDTVLFADSLHYAPLETQDAVLARAAAALRPGGRLIVRDVDARPGWRSVLTRLSEHVSGLLRRRRSAHAYRSAEALVQRLETLGLVPFRLEDPVGGPYDNPIIVAENRVPAHVAPGDSTHAA